MLRLLNGSQRLTCRSSRFITILGIETSCDDTAVCIMNDRKEVLSARTFTDRQSQLEKGGICPGSVAQQHRNHLSRLLEECFEEAQTLPQDLTAIAVTTTPGLVIALKEGIKTAIQLAKDHRKPLIPVHHMRAHALAAFAVASELKFPFLAVLISGGHALFVLVKDVDDFKLIGHSSSGSPGECLDKIARELKITERPEFVGIHPGAAIEIIASRASYDGHLRYPVPGPLTASTEMNFSQLKSNLLGMLKKFGDGPDFVLEDVCATAQYQVARHICSRLNAVFDGLESHDDQLKNLEHVVIGGGVASNRYITNAISKLSLAYGLDSILIPKRLCTDNAEMIALTGLLKLENRSADIMHWSEIPEMIYAHARSDIGEDVRHWLPEKPTKTVSGPSIHGERPIYIYRKEDFKK